jgi:hypothetical protein
MTRTPHVAAYTAVQKERERMSDHTSRRDNEGRAAALGESKFNLGPLEAFIAREKLLGAAVQVPDDAMSPVVFQRDLVRVEKRASEAEVRPLPEAGA